MTIDKCRHELAKNAGWKTHGRGWWRDAKLHLGQKHNYAEDPIPATLDEAAKLPEGWVWKCIQEPRYNNPDVFECEAGRRSKDGGWGFDDACTYGATELEARFRLRVAVERVEKKLLES